jgi:putative transposase
VDQDGNILAIVAQSRRDKMAAKQFFRTRLNRLRYMLRVIATDRLPS